MLYPLLNFNKQCAEAMEFYKSCFGGELKMQSVGKSPASDNFPKSMHPLILHAALTGGKANIMGSDMQNENTFSTRGMISLLINCTNEKEMKILYQKLSKNGKKIHEIASSFSGNLHGELQDKFGVTWVLFERVEEMV